MFTLVCDSPSQPKWLWTLDFFGGINPLPTVMELCGYKWDRKLRKQTSKLNVYIQSQPTVMASTVKNGIGKRANKTRSSVPQVSTATQTYKPFKSSNATHRAIQTNALNGLGEILNSTVLKVKAKQSNNIWDG